MASADSSAASVKAKRLGCAIVMLPHPSGIAVTCVASRAMQRARVGPNAPNAWIPARACAKGRWLGRICSSMHR
jgi:hypothetical protein